MPKEINLVRLGLGKANRTTMNILKLLIHEIRTDGGLFRRVRPKECSRSHLKAIQLKDKALRTISSKFKLICETDSSQTLKERETRKSEF